MMHSKYGGLNPKLNFGIDHGDIIDAICSDDKRYDNITVEGDLLVQMDNAIAHRQKIKNKIIAILDGNHPRKHWRFGFITQRVCKELGVRYGDWSCVFDYRDQKDAAMFKHYTTHGKVSISSRIDDPKDRKNAELRSLKRYLKDKVGDCVLMTMGHVHKLRVYNPEPELYVTVGKNIEQNYTEADQTAHYIHPYQRWYVAAGSFLKTLGEGYAGYPEIAGYDPLQIGCAVALIRGGKLAGVDEIHFK